MIALFDRVDKLALDKCRRFFQDRRAQTTLAKRLAADAITFALERFEKRKCLAFLIFTENIQCKYFRIFDNRVRAGVGLHAHDHERRLERGLRSEEHTSELQSQSNLVCRLLLEKKK